MAAFGALTCFRFVDIGDHQWIGSRDAVSQVFGMYFPDRTCSNNPYIQALVSIGPLLLKFTFSGLKSTPFNL